MNIEPQPIREQFPDPCSIQHVTLERMIYGFQRQLDLKQLGALSLNMREVYLTDEARFMVFELEQFLYGRHVEKEMTVSYPAGCWEHFKQRWAPKWFLKRWPVKMTPQRYKYVEARIMCPHLHVPDNNHHVAFVVNKEPEFQALLPFFKKGE